MTGTAQVLYLTDMTTSVLNRQRRRRIRAQKRAERRRQRRIAGDYRYPRSEYCDGDSHPNRQRDTWHQSKDAR